MRPYALSRLIICSIAHQEQKNVHETSFRKHPKYLAKMPNDNKKIFIIKQKLYLNERHQGLPSGHTNTMLLSRIQQFNR
jgi:hypothetical protein